MTDQYKPTFYTTVPFPDLYMMCILEQLSRDEDKDCWTSNILKGNITDNNVYMCIHPNIVRWYTSLTEFNKLYIWEKKADRFLSIVDFLWEVL